jgi:uncharacterized protein (DUF58 family)
VILTRQGLMVTLAAVALVVAGRFFGTLELFLLGTAAAALVGAVVLRAVLVRVDVTVRRSVHPSRVHSGTPSRIDLEITNVGRRSTPVLQVVDAVSGTRGADLSLAPLGAGATLRAAYRLPTERRGLVQIGPLDLVIGDPFGFTSVRIRSAGQTDLTIYPHIDPIAGLPETAGQDPDASQEAPTALGRSGEEFFALRPFQVGDELRKVHWPASARLDELQVRQTELPWQGRVTVLLDLRGDVHSDPSLDVAVSAAASIITAARRTGDLVRLVATDGTDSGFLPGNAAYSAILEYLATVPRGPAANIARLLESLSRTSHGGALVVVTGAIGEHDRSRIDSIRHRYSSLTTVTIDRSAWDPRAVEAPSGDERFDDVRVSRSRDFPTAWNRAMGLRRTARRSTYARGRT